MATANNQTGNKQPGQQNTQTSQQTANAAGSEDFIYTVVQRYVTDLQSGKSQHRAR